MERGVWETRPRHYAEVGWADAVTPVTPASGAPARQTPEGSVCVLCPGGTVISRMSAANISEVGKIKRQRQDFQPVPGYGGVGGAWAPASPPPSRWGQLARRERPGEPPPQPRWPARLPAKSLPAREGQKQRRGLGKRREREFVQIQGRPMNFFCGPVVWHSFIHSFIHASVRSNPCRVSAQVGV